MFRLLKSRLLEFFYSYRKVGSGRVSNFNIDNLGFEFRAVEPESSKDSIFEILLLLRTTPYWTLGHLRLGYLALQSKDIELAFNSFEAVRKLRPKNQIERLAIVGTLRCLLAKGEAYRALNLINNLPVYLLNDNNIKEQQVACCMILEDYQKAKYLIDSIPIEERNVEIVTMLSYLQSRQVI